MAGNMERFCVLAVLIGITIALSIRFNAVQPEPYMDEIFHVPQAQNYCHYNFSHWNKKITTLPGLYIVSFMLFQISQFFPVGGLARDADSTQSCSTVFLRSLNVLFMLGNFWLLFQLSYKINSNFQLFKESSNAKEETSQYSRSRKSKKMPGKIKSGSAEQIEGLSTDVNETEGKIDIESRAFANAIALSIFPILFFFTFLYYTDQGSTFMVLLMYWLSFEESHLTAAFTGAVAVIFRQTNIVWVCFVAGSSLLRIIQNDLPNIDYGVKEFIFSLVQSSVSKLQNIVTTAIPYLSVAVGFVVFIVKNNGIVVGDRSSHQACLNVPQIFYFIGFSMAFGSPLFLSEQSINAFIEFMKVEVLTCKKRLFMLFLCLFVMALLVLKLTYVHEYLLADNRHYTFYIWRRIFQRYDAINYLAIPIYFYGAFTMQRLLMQQNSGLWIFVFAAAVCLVTIPQKLLEFRYFIIPYLLLRLHVPIPSYLSLCLEIALYLSVNALTVGLFLYKPFLWENESATQRFMW